MAIRVQAAALVSLLLGLASAGVCGAPWHGQGRRGLAKATPTGRKPPPPLKKPPPPAARRPPPHTAKKPPPKAANRSPPPRQKKPPPPKAGAKKPPPAKAKVPTSPALHSSPTKKSKPPPPKAPPPPPLSTQQRLDNFVAFLSKQNIYSNYIDALGSTGFNKTLVKLMASYNLTIFVPTDSAFSALTLGQMRRIYEAPSGTGFLQLIAFNTLFGTLRWRTLVAAPPGTAYVTADFPSSPDIRAYKLRTMRFSGDPTWTLGAYPQSGMMYYDLHYGARVRLLAHGTDRVMVPRRFV